MGVPRIPKKLEEEMDLLQSDSGSDKMCLVTESNIRRRIIPILDDVTENTFEQVLNIYNAITEDNDELPIKFLVGTRGGDARSMLGIMNLILLNKIPCYTYLISETYSAGAFIYLSGHKRFAARTGLASLMLHPMNWTLVESQVAEHTAHANHATELSKQLMKIIEPRTSLSKKRLKELVTNDTYFFIGEELFKYGIATDAIEDISELLEIPSKKSKLAQNKNKKEKVTLVD